MKETLNSGESPSFDGDVDRVLAPWERVFDRFSTPLEYFIHQESSSGLILFVCAILAVVAANSTMATAYHHWIELPITIGLGSWEVSKSLHHWVNDGLMTLFFFVVGLEIKREMLVGELSNPRQAALPIVAALAGMVTPALKIGLVQMPQDMTTQHVFGIAQLAGIGFTMSMFISELAFGGSPELVAAAKSGILLASIAAGLAGLLWLRLLPPAPGRRADLG